MTRQKNATKTQTVDQNREKLLFRRLESLRTGGAVVSSWRTYKGQRLGPYFRLAYRVAGQQKSLFIGADAEMAEKVRSYLGGLQKKQNERIALDRARRAAAQQFAASLEQLDVQLAAAGLRRRGSQVIGWREWKRHQGSLSRIEKFPDECNGMPYESQTEQS